MLSLEKTALLLSHLIYTNTNLVKDIFVQNEQKIKQRDIIGTIGSTGRATGAHLDGDLIGSKLD